MTADRVEHVINGHRRELLRAAGMGISFVKAEGDFLYDKEGVRFYDASAQYGANIFGHNDPKSALALTEYIARLGPNLVQPFVLGIGDDLARRLVSLTRTMDLCLFANSGAEAVEAAIKLARLTTGKRRVISLKGSFHGKTQLALSVSGSNRFSNPLITNREDCEFVASNDIERLRAIVESGEIAAFLFEPVIGEGGMKVVDFAFLSEAIEICRKANVIVIADEVQCGMFRCEGLLVSDALDLEVDVALLGKGLGGGLMPISAVLYRAAVRSNQFDRKHSSTFAGGGLACAVALDAVNRLADNSPIRANVARLSQLIDDHGKRLANDITITGMGLMRGIYFKNLDPDGCCGLTFLMHSQLLAYLISSYFLNRHRIVALPLLSQDCAIRFEPALTTTPEMANAFFDAVADVSQLIRNGRYDIIFGAILGRAECDLPDRSITIKPYNNDDARSLAVLPASADGERLDFAFLSHLTCAEDIVQLLPRAVRENLASTEIDMIVRMVTAIGIINPTPAPLLAFEISGLREKRRGVILSSLIYPERMMRLSKRDREDLVESYFGLAESYGVKVVGLGAYTSIITRGGTSAAIRFPEFCLTTGNTLTAAATCSLLHDATGGQTERTAIIGARGSIGRLVMLKAAQISNEIVLVGRRSASVASYRELLILLCREMLGVAAPTTGTVAARIRDLLPADASDEEIKSILPQITSNELNKAVITVSSDHEAALKDASAVVSCTSRGKSFLSQSLLRKDAVVLDAARPFDFAINAGSEPKILEAGLVRQPSPLRYGDNNLLVEQTGMALGCLSETVILSMEGIDKSFMIGAEASLEVLREIERLAARHGFLLTGEKSPTDTLVDHHEPSFEPIEQLYGSTAM
jgi:acetylornithine/succinyldiaminopimelate/putrescine aminotransferase/predicted amino acid dehydrogenase